MYIYKLKYNDRATAITDLIAKGVIDTNENNTFITQAVVDLGIIVLTSGTYDENGVEITSPVYADGYHFDVMVTQAIDFGTARVTPTNSVHAFLGFNINQFNKIRTNETTTN
jgi:hypothetical protein